MRSTKKMLALDGGGIRGILPAMMLAELERRAPQSVCALFDLLAGTAPGGILALGLTVPGEPGKPTYRAADLVGFYAQEGRALLARSVWHRVRSVGGKVLLKSYPRRIRWRVPVRCSRGCAPGRYASVSRTRDFPNLLPIFATKMMPAFC